MNVPTLTANQIAKKWNLSLVTVKRLISDGEKVEKEHTTNIAKANEIARDHIGERPDYYKKLHKLEKSKISMKEETGVGGVRGLGFVSGAPAAPIDYVGQYIGTNMSAYGDDGAKKMKYAQSIHNKLHKLKFNDFTHVNIRNAKNFVNEGISAGPEREVPIIGDLTGSSRKVMKVDEIKLPNVPEKVKTKTKKAIAVGMTAANLATGASVYDNASRGVGSPIRDVAAAASGLPGKIGYAAMGTNYTIKGFDKAREHLRQKQKLKEDLRKWFREKWVRYDTKGNIKGPCARDEGEGKPKCRPLASARAMSKDERAKSARRKRREDPVADRPGKGGKPIMVRTEETLLEKNVPTNPSLWARAKAQAKAKFDVYPSAYANGWAAKWYKSKGGGWKSAANESIEEACWDTHRQEGMKKKGGKMVPNCVPKEELSLQDIAKRREVADSTKTKDVFDRMRTGTPKGVIDLSSKKSDQVNETGQVMSRYTERPTYEANNKYPDTAERGIYEGDPMKDAEDKIKNAFTADKVKGMFKRVDKERDKDPKWVAYKKRKQQSMKEEQIDEISAELVGKVSNARFFRGETPSKTLTRAINKKFIEFGKKDKGKANKDKKEVKEAVMAMPPQVQPPAIHGSQRAGVQRQVSRPTSMSGSASGRIAGQSGSMSARPNVKVSSGVQPSIERSWKTSGRGTMGTSGGSMSATPKVSTAYSQGGVNVGKAMGASKQTSPVVKGMTSAGREAASVVSKAAPMASRVAGAALRVAGGPAATAAAAVMSPTAANAGEDEKKRQATLKDYNPYKPSGRSVSDYEKQVGLTKPNINTSQSQGSVANVDTPKGGSIGADVGRTTASKVNAPQPPSRPDYFSRGQAFQAARGEAGGAGGKFSYGGKEFQTNVAGEKYASKPKQTSVTDIKETTMDTKDLINEALDDILENNLVSMKENLMTVLQEKAMEKIEERKKIIAANYFGQE